MFSVAICNPPYSGNLHLRILEKVIPVAKEVVNISPIRWLQDPLAKYKKNSDLNKFEDSIAKHIESLEEVDTKSASDMFFINQYENLGIYKINNTIYDKNFSKPKIKCLFDKVNLPVYKHKYTSIYDVRSKEGEPDYSLPYIKISPLHGNVGSNDWCDVISKNKELVTTEKTIKGGSLYCTLNFNSEEERDNCFNSLQTIFIKACNYNVKTNIRVPGYAIPFMNDYSKPWTNERFCEYFGITGFISDTEAEPNSEWEEILNTMKQYE